MAISALSSAATATNTPATSSTKNTVSKDDFLRLFLAQLKNQDPLSPMESTEFTAQLAQFSSLEQLTNINDNLKSMLVYQSSLQNTLTSNLIGKQVGFYQTDAGGTQTMKYGTVTALSFDDGKTLIVVDDGSKITPSQVKEIR